MPSAISLSNTPIQTRTAPSNVLSLCDPHTLGIFHSVYLDIPFLTPPQARILFSPLQCVYIYPTQSLSSFPPPNAHLFPKTPPLEDNRPNDFQNWFLRTRPELARALAVRKVLAVAKVHPLGFIFTGKWVFFGGYRGVRSNIPQSITPCCTCLFFIPSHPRFIATVFHAPPPASQKNISH